MSEETTVHYFLPAVRYGLAGQIGLQAASAHRASVDVSLTVDGKAVGHATSTVEVVTKKVSLYGPGDVLGFDGARIVARTDPKPDVGDFEPNYFPCVEFVDADFPWRFTADEFSGNRLDPWIALVVLARQSKGEVEQEFAEVRPRSADLPRCIKVLNAKSLPSLGDAWRWAHVRVTAKSGLSMADVEKLLLDRPGQAVSVLHCPRRLAPGVQYSAFVVPAFKLGLEAALGRTLGKETGATQPAWERNEGEIELPYYFRWDFGTGMLGDFERLVRLLEPRELTQLGKRPIDCSDPGFGLAGVNRPDVESVAEKGLLEMEGALQSLDTEYTPWGYDAPPEGPAAPNDHQPPNAFQTDLARLLNRPNTEDPAGDSSDVVHTVDAGSPIQVADITWEYMLLQNELVVRWGANPSAFCEFKYGRSGQGLQPAMTAGHSATVKRLVSEQEYRFEIVAGEARTTGTFRVVLPQVVPPVYGRWHFGKLKTSSNEPDKKLIVDPKSVPSWLEELNLDLRHRAAAGMGAEVVRKNQEPLMASAWEQLGEVERANDILRRAQLGRDSSLALHKRLGHMRAEDFLRVTRAAQRVVFFDEAISPLEERAEKLKTATAYLAAHTRVPTAALDPAFRRIASPRRAIRTRQLRKISLGYDSSRGGTAWPESMVQRLLEGFLEPAGPVRKPLGLSSIGAVSKEFISRSSLPESDPSAAGRDRRRGSQRDDIRGKAFDETAIDGGLIGEILKDKELFEGLEGPAKEVFEGITTAKLGAAVVGVFGGWLDQTEKVLQAPTKDTKFLDELKTQVRAQLHPAVTIVERTKSRFRWAGVVQQHFNVDARRDPLDPILWAPEFDYPMYEPLLDLGHAALLPGVEKIPQNTIGVLKANRRFVEAYLTGCNHEFAGELLWRGYPTDQRGTYFRQFWDVSEHRRSSSEEKAVLSSELRRRGYSGLDQMPPAERLFILASDLRATTNALSDISSTETSDEAKRLMELLHAIDSSGADALAGLTGWESWLEPVVRWVLIENGLADKWRDIRPLTQWPVDHRLGNNGRAVEGGLILVIRGDLLKRYPSALIYAVDEVEEQDGQQQKKVPGLKEFLPDGRDVPDRIYPIFRASMPPDLMFFGFPFSERDARGETQEAAKYFVMEQAPGEPRHGLDESDVPQSSVSTSDDLTWGSFGFGSSGQSKVGEYLDDPGPASAFSILYSPKPLLGFWSKGTSAHRARYTWQKPVRIVVDAKQLLPRKR